jgi:hypothetical protein
VRKEEALEDIAIANASPSSKHNKSHEVASKLNAKI